MWSTCQLVIFNFFSITETEKKDFNFQPHQNHSGYRVRLKLCLNGSGSFKGSHISIFLAVMRGPYDSLLHWPFQHTVAFWLLDQSPLKDSFSKAFKPRKNPSFNKPSSETNPPSGLPEFLSLSHFEASYDRYVQDDVAFIKVVFMKAPEGTKTLLATTNQGKMHHATMNQGTMHHATLHQTTMHHTTTASSHGADELGKATVGVKKN